MTNINYKKDSQMLKKRQSKKNELCIEIKDTKNQISQSRSIIGRLRNQTGDIEYTKNQITKYKNIIDEKSSILVELEDKLKELELGNLDDLINKEFEDNKRIIEEKNKESLRIKELKRKEKEKTKEISKNFWNNTVKSSKSNNQLKKNIIYSRRYFYKVIDSIPDYIKRNLKEMPNNKGYIWRGVNLYGERPARKGEPHTLFEKKKGDILVIHEYHRTSNGTLYKRFEKQGKGKKKFIFER